MVLYVIEPKLIVLDYDLIRGMPGEVATKVQSLLAERDGWQPSGEPKILELYGQVVIVQCMVQYEKDYSGEN